MDVNTDGVVDSVVNLAAAVDDLPIFCEPVDSSYFDEFSLKTVLIARQQEQTFHVTSNDKSRDEPSTISNIKNIEKVLNFEEDVADFSLVEKLSDSLSGLKLEENVEEPSIDDSSEKSIVPAKISAKGVTTWAVTTQILAVEFEKLRPNLALEYPFELDVFQKQAVMRLERRENVFVAAHTSAGKTVVAEYAIALSLKNNTRSIYTSPIKALSNQKYRDFREKFGVENVGIITGDVSVNPNAPCLIMTTEIFRSMLYKGADTIRDIEFVVFDEVHYVNDAERGVVWEEVIIMLPEHVCLIFLSATTPNALEFSEWIGRTKHRKVYVTSTNKRPVPLQHFLLHDLEMYKMMHAETGYNPAALAAATKHSRDKDKPKPMTAENAKFAAQRQGEKTANAARNAGVSVKQLQAGRGGGRGGGGRGGPAGRGGTGGGGNRGPGGKGGDVSGGKAQWNSLLKILQAGGREAAGGMGAINFGVATATTVLSAKARSEKNAMDKYERLPLEMRQAMSKKEYEATHVRADDDEDVGDGSVGLLPVVVFSFSKKKCEEIADFLKGQDLLTNREKGKVKMLLNEVFGRLSPADAELPQVLRLKDMLCRGIGVHHGGLLPILKETVEILFAESIVKVLFATETFAMGVNMPARSVVFNGFSKHDGKSRRDLLPGEYTQMAGRAGRRGLDEVGTVILCAWTNLPEEQQLKKLLTGTATRLSSQFRMRYNMILNLVRVNDLTVEDMMKRSFTEYHTQKALASHDLTAKLRKYEGLVSFLENQQAEDTGNEFAGEVEQYLDLFSSCQELLHAQLRNISDKCRPATVSTLLGPGRLVHLHCERVGAPSLGMVLAVKSGAADVSAVSSTSTSKVNGETPSALQLARAGLTQKHNEKFGDGNGSEVSGGSLDSGDLDLHVWVLVPLRSDRVPSALVSREPLASDLLDMGGVFSEVYGVTAQEEGALEQVYVVTRVPVKQLASLLSVTLRIGTAASETVGSSSARTISVHSFCRPINDVGDNYDLLCSTSSYVDLVRESRLNDLDFCDRQSRLLNQLKRLPPFALSIPQVADRYLLAFKVQRARRKMDFIRHYISDKNMTLFPDFQQRIKVLSLLGYVDKDCKVITPKGRAACELNSCDELLGTEILFNNVLEPLNPPEAAAMLAALVFQEKNDVEDALTTRMETAKAAMTDILQQLVVLQEMEGVVLDPDSKPILNFGLSAVVYQWARGMSFKEITDLTMVQEGTIVRAITRLDELCRDFRNAAVVIGNPSLYRKMEAASLCIKRDIVFAGSLYIS